MNENQLTNVEEYEFIKPLFQKTDSIFNDCIRDCCNKFSIHLITYVNMILNLQTSLIMN